MNSRAEQKIVPLHPSTEVRTDLERMYDDHALYLTKTVRSIIGEDADVEDVVQQTFVVALEKIDSLKKRDSMRFWLAGIAINLCRRNLRKKSLLRRLGFQPLSVEPGVASRTEDQIIVRELYRLIQTLPANERIAWTLSRIEGEDFATVAMLCDCSVSTCKRRVAAAQSKLERWWRDA